MNIDTLVNPSILLQDLIPDPYLRHFLGLGFQQEKVRKVEEANEILTEISKEPFKHGKSAGIKQGMIETVGGGDIFVFINDPNVPLNERIIQGSNLKDMMEKMNKEQLTSIFNSVLESGAKIKIQNTDDLATKIEDTTAGTILRHIKKRYSTMSPYRSKLGDTITDSVVIFNQRALTDGSIKLQTEGDFGDPKYILVPNSVDILTQMSKGKDKGKTKKKGETPPKTEDVTNYLKRKKYAKQESLKKLGIKKEKNKKEVLTLDNISDTSKIVDVTEETELDTTNVVNISTLPEATIQNVSSSKSSTSSPQIKIILPKPKSKSSGSTLPKTAKSSKSSEVISQIDKLIDIYSEGGQPRLEAELNKIKRKPTIANKMVLESLNFDINNPKSPADIIAKKIIDHFQPTKSSGSSKSGGSTKIAQSAKSSKTSSSSTSPKTEEQKQFLTWVRKYGKGFRKELFLEELNGLRKNDKSLAKKIILEAEKYNFANPTSQGDRIAETIIDFFKSSNILQSSKSSGSTKIAQSAKSSKSSGSTKIAQSAKSSKSSGSFQSAKSSRTSSRTSSKSSASDVINNINISKVKTQIDEWMKKEGSAGLSSAVTRIRKNETDEVIAMYKKSLNDILDTLPIMEMEAKPKKMTKQQKKREIAENLIRYFE